MKVAELFPKCNAIPCPLGGTGRHHHVLPKQQEALDSTERVLGMIGGYGSAKTLAGMVLGHLLSVSIPGNMGIVVRR